MAPNIVLYRFIVLNRFRLIDINKEQSYRITAKRESLQEEMQGTVLYVRIGVQGGGRTKKRAKRAKQRSNF